MSERFHRRCVWASRTSENSHQMKRLIKLNEQNIAGPLISEIMCENLDKKIGET